MTDFIMEKIFGDDIVKMCRLLDKTIPDTSDDGKIIEKGIASLMIRMQVMGFVLGVISTILCVAIISLLEMKGLI